jgi:GTP-binding protein HflX
VLVFNKLDALEPSQRPRRLQDDFELEGQSVQRVFVSARTGEGLAQLRQVLSAQARAGAGLSADGQSPDIRGAQA